MDALARHGTALLLSFLMAACSAMDLFLDGCIVFRGILRDETIA